MTKTFLTTCDCCGDKINLYHGAFIEIVEQCGNVNRVYPNQDRASFDLCDDCYRSIAKLLKQMRLLGD